MQIIAQGLAKKLGPDASRARKKVRADLKPRSTAMEGTMSKPNWFPTLNAALESEGLVELWPLGLNIKYGETADTVQEGRYISVYRDQDGNYERPIHYSCEDAFE